MIDSSYTVSHMTQPAQNYKTLSGLLKATENVLADTSGKNVASQSRAMWLQNADYVATTFFNSNGVKELRKKFSVSRLQDLNATDGGHAVFGFPLPTRRYDVGDNVPGVGLITDKVELKDGFYQFEIGKMWYHESSVDPSHQRL